ncbi:HAD family hydrolase [Clostridium beijerinckii]|uniref:HAD family hydrolase n=1 Tax=Clostridium beijerinckii TaxID=1520 RepID=A0A1S8S3K1_CLOBE|nr:HAD family phosphatase [Clostridium beijerinckii]NRY60628.1 HAD superfamily hydrolase (TIGR01509 family) [Clostridium beijerinckii]OOM60028.1 phosphorylated carbohydrates phosphatase [Clostridium beijerinckii]OOP74696.1 HAD family hydrolase [Clostridium beijerinckii]
MKKAVIFDMDGVLVYTEQYYFNRRMKFFDELGIEPRTRKIQDFIGLSSDMIWEMLVPEDKEKRERLEKEYLKYSKKNEVNFLQVLNPSTKEVLNRLKDNNIKIAIASSSKKLDILRMIKDCKISDYIDFVISGEECENDKPDPEIYIKAIKTLGFLSKEVIVVEDSKLGIRAAKAAGLNVIALAQKEYDIDQSEADFKINDLIEVVEKI